MSTYDWRKTEKALYIPKEKPEQILIPKFRFFTINGSGNPNDEAFSQYIEALYALSYAVKMSPRKGNSPPGYYEYSVYPLEGVWDISDEAKASFKGTIDKNQLVFKLMIRQPDFVNEKFALDILEFTKKKKNNPLIEQLVFEEIEEGSCIQMLHVGSYDDEPLSFSKMEAFAEKNGLKRKSKIHREIYLSDARRTPAEKLKTILRFQLIS